MGVREKIFFIYGFIILLSFSITFKDEKAPIEMSEPQIAYSNCEERNYSVLILGNKKYSNIFKKRKLL